MFCKVCGNAMCEVVYRVIHAEAEYQLSSLYSGEHEEREVPALDAAREQQP